MELLNKSKQAFGYMATALLLFSSTACMQTKKPVEVAKEFTTEYKSDNTLSFANNVMHASGLRGVRDSKLKGGKGKVRTGGISVTELALGSTVDILSNPLKLGNSTMLGLNALFWLNSKESTESMNLIMAWAPQANNNELDALRGLESKVVNQIDEYFKINPVNFNRIPFPVDDTGVKDINFSGYSLIGDNCKPLKDADSLIDLKCAFGLIVSSKSEYKNSAKRFFGTVKAKAPDFVEHKEAVFIRAVLFGRTMNFFFNPIENSIASLNVWQYVSENLPDYAYIYLAPRKYTYLDPSIGVVLGKAPLVISKGKINMFITYDDDE